MKVAEKIFDYVHKTSLRLMAVLVMVLINQAIMRLIYYDKAIQRQSKKMIIYYNDPHQLCKNNVWCSKLNQNDEIKYNDQQRQWI